MWEVAAGSYMMHKDAARGPDWVLEGCLPLLSWFWLGGPCDQLRDNNNGYTMAGRPDGGQNGSFPCRFIKACFSSACLSFPHVVQPALALSTGSDRQASWWTPTHFLQSNLAHRTNQPHWSRRTWVYSSLSSLLSSLTLSHYFFYLSLSLEGIVHH